MSNEDQFREKYLEFQMLEQIFMHLQQKKAVVENQAREFADLAENLDSIPKLKRGSSAYSSIGSGVFLKTELKDPDHVLVNIGSDIAVEKSVIESKRLVEIQIKELKEIQKKLDQDIAEHSKRVLKINEELAVLSREKQS